MDLDQATPAGPGALRVGVNLFPLQRNGGGMRQYVLQLLPWLLRLSPHTFVLFHRPHGLPSLAAMRRPLGPAERHRLRFVSIEDQDEIFGHAQDFDAYFCPLNCLAPDLLDRPVVATLADVQERFLPQYFTPEQLEDRARHYPRMAHAATLLLTLSEFSKRTICEAFGVAADKVRAIPLSPNDGLVGARPAWPAALPPLPRRYVFYPANLYPHKDHRALLDALVLLNRERGEGVGGVLTGQPVEPGIDLRREVRARGLDGRVLWLGHVHPSHLRHLYENAVALAFPSRFEGFGLPLVEAMLCGCPVVATHAASVPEVVGGAALLTDGTPRALADAVARLLDDPALADDLRARGRTRAAQFTTRRLAQATLAALDDAVARFVEQRRRDPGGPAVSFVVRPAAGGRALAETLASLAAEVLEHDEVLVLGPAGRAGAAAEALADNLGVVRSAGRPADPGAWADEARHECVCYLEEGDCLVEGATGAALAALNDEPPVAAVVGEVLGRDGKSGLTGVRYSPTAGRGLGRGAPPAAVFWARSLLRAERAALARPNWPARVLARAAGRVRLLYRTVATAPPPPGAAAEAGSPGRPLAAWALVARRLGRLRGPGRALARRLPFWLADPLRGLYRRFIRPHATER